MPPGPISMGGCAVPSMVNVTVPVGVPGPLCVTVAVDATASPGLLGTRVKASEVVVGVLLTSWLIFGDVLPPKLLSLLLLAALPSLPSVSAEVVKVVMPPGPISMGGCAVPSMVNVTVPVGVAGLPVPVTVAVNATA